MGSGAEVLGGGNLGEEWEVAEDGMWEEELREWRASLVVIGRGGAEGRVQQLKREERSSPHDD